MTKWTKADSKRFEDHCVLAAVATGLPVDQAKLVPLEERGFVQSRTVYEITEAGRKWYRDTAAEIEKVSRES